MKELSRPPEIPKPTPEITASPAAPGLPVSREAFWRRILNPFRQEAAYLAKAFGSWPAAVQLLFVTFGLTLAYQAPLDYSFVLGKANITDYLYLQSFNPAEANSQFSFRWTTDESYLRFQGIGRLPSAELQLEMQAGGRPANLPLPKVQVWKDGQLLGEVEVTSARKFYSFDYRETGNFAGGDLLLTLKVQNSFKEAGHDLPLGVVITRVRLTGGSADGRPVVPSPAHFVFLLAALLAIYLALVRSGWTPQVAAVFGGVFGLGAALALGTVRLVFTPVIEELFLTIALGYVLLVLGLRTMDWWLTRRNLTIPSAQMRWLGLIFLSAFVVKAVGLNYPAFGVVDHWFRVHQIYRFWNQPAAFWQQYYNVSTGATVTGQEGGSAVLGQWGLQASLPYSPLFYLFAAPLSFFWPDYHNVNLLAAVNLLVSWLETTQIFLLYLIVRLAYRTAGSGWAGVLAGAIFGFYPLSFLLFSDGGYNSIFAAWLSLLFVALLVDWLRQRSQLKSPLNAGRKGSRWLAVWLVLSLSAALLAHTSTLLLLGTLMVVFSGFLLLGRSTRQTGKAAAFLTLAGLFVAFILYYGWYVPGLVGQTLPLLFGKLGSGAVGQEANKLGGPLLSGFWPQLWEHFRFWPFLGLLGFLFLARPKAASTPLDISNGSAPVASQEKLEENLEEKPPFMLLWWSWLLVFIIFSVVDLRVNLLQKHMLFVAPLLCIGSGLLVVQLWQLAKGREWWWRWSLAAVVGILLMFTVTGGLLLWFNRVYLGISPPGSG